MVSTSLDRRVAWSRPRSTDEWRGLDFARPTSGVVSTSLDRRVAWSRPRSTDEWRGLDLARPTSGVVSTSLDRRVAWSRPRSTDEWRGLDLARPTSGVVSTSLDRRVAWSRLRSTDEWRGLDPARPTSGVVSTPLDRRVAWSRQARPTRYGSTGHRWLRSERQRASRNHLVALGPHPVSRRRARAPLLHHRRPSGTTKPARSPGRALVSRRSSSGSSVELVETMGRV